MTVPPLHTAGPISPDGNVWLCIPKWMNVGGQDKKHTWKQMAKVTTSIFPVATPLFRRKHLLLSPCCGVVFFFFDPEVLKYVSCCFIHFCCLLSVMAYISNEMYNVYPCGRGDRIQDCSLWCRTEERMNQVVKNFSLLSHSEMGWIKPKWNGEAGILWGPHNSSSTPTGRVDVNLAGHWI